MRKHKHDKPLYISLYGGKDKDFHVRIISEDRLINSAPGLDLRFSEDMHNYGDSEDLPDSDRYMICQQKGIRQEDCDFNQDA